VSSSLVVVQAVAAAISALTAAFLVYVTVKRDRDARAERKRDLAHEQIRRLVDGLQYARSVMHDTRALEQDFGIARAQIAAAIALSPIELPACQSLLAEDMPKPPYNVGEIDAFERLNAALDEVRRYSRMPR
jgi:hypothetical protein